MGLSKRKLKGLIEYSDLRNEAGLYNEDDVIGVSTSKEMIATKANLDGVNLLNYKLFPPNSFAYVADTSRRGDKIALTYNNTSRTYIVSTWYVVFNLSEEAKDVLFPDYLFLYFNRSEFDRYARTNSWGSAREYFWFQDMEDIIIELPPIDIQRKYVDVYFALQKNLAVYQSKVDELKLVCDGYIEELRRKMKCEKIGKYIKRYSEKNTDKAIDEVVGLSTEKKFRIAQSRVNREELGGYKIVHPLDIAYVPTTDTWKVLAFAVNHFEKDVVVSPIYEVFATTGKLKSDYLAIWLKREEFDRYARYNSWGSARENFTFEEMQQVEIPIPNEKIQQSIIDLYLVYEKRKAIAVQLKEQLKNICPVLIRGSLEEKLGGEE